MFNNVSNIGVATVEFKTEKDTDQAMRKNKNFISSKRIFLYKVKKDVQGQVEEKSRPWELKVCFLKKSFNSVSDFDIFSFNLFSQHDSYKTYRFSMCLVAV